MKYIRFITPVQKFIRIESFSGILLFGSAVLAFILANTPARTYLEFLWDYKIGFTSDNFQLIKPLILWINDGLMAVFFFLIGLEMKREILIGELNSVKKASLPILAALGGMMIPVILFMLINTDPAAEGAWGISMATDIAFTLAILKLLGTRVPLSLKIFLTAFAIIDDLGAVVVIAVVYSTEVSWSLLLIAGIILALLYLLSFLKLHSKFVLILAGVLVWLLFLKSGIHPTLAGVLLGFAVPIRQKINEFEFSEQLQDITRRLVASVNTNKLPVLTDIQISTIDDLEDMTNKVQSPVQQLEHRLHPWVAFLIMPVFALANSGVSVSGGEQINMDLVIAIASSLFIGKTIGVSLFSFLALKLKLATLPDNIRLKQIIGVAVLSGVGFTISLFIAGLAFAENEIYMSSAKVGILLGSLLSAIIGYLILRNQSSTSD